MSERNYYCICEDNCRFPTMTSEQILAAIAEATGNTVTNIDDAFIAKIREMNANKNITFWIGKSAEYNAIAATDAIVENCLYIITDESIAEDIEEAITILRLQIESLNARINKSDSGWLAWVCNGTTIGSYRLKDGIAYFVMSGASYEITGDVGKITLPVLLDMGDVKAPISLRVAVYENIGKTYVPLSYDKNTGSLTLGASAISGGDLYGTFTFPYISENPNYDGAVG